MDWQSAGQSKVPRALALGTGLVVTCGPNGWAVEARADDLIHAGQNWQRHSYAQPSRLTEAAFQPHAASLERAETRGHERSDRTEGERRDLPASTMPQVEVRVGDHGEFERLAFEWPQAIEYELAQHAEQVTIAFSRPGRIDLSRVAGRLRQVVKAWAENGDATASVTLRLLPDTRVRSFNLKDGRVAVDLFGGTLAQSLAAPAYATEQEAIQYLRRALEQRDAVIEERDEVIDQLNSRLDQLTARFERLEQALALSSGDLERVTAGHAGPMASVGVAPRPPARSPSVSPDGALGGHLSGEAPAARSQAATFEQSAIDGEGRGPDDDTSPTRQQTAQTRAPAPGQVEVDEEAAERALDFTLVQQGALLLPFGRAEFTPSFTYTRRTDDFPVVIGPPGNQVVAEQDIRRNEFEFLSSFLLGLPFDSQLELGLPYNLVQQSDRVLGTEDDDRTGHGIGDVSIGLAKTVLRERNWLPDVVLRVNWDTGTGESQDNDVVLDGGFQELTGSISLTKRQDPLVFVGGASYEAAFEHNDIDPGDTLGFSIGTFLAASPDTSLRVVLNQSFIDEFKVDGQTIDGSDQVQSILTFGASAILGRNVLLDGAVGIGLTDDSPDYSVSVSLPIRFSTPGL